MACQFILGYFMPRGKAIMFIVFRYLHFCGVSFFAHGPIDYE